MCNLKCYRQTNRRSGAKTLEFFFIIWNYCCERTPNENASTNALRASEAERTPNENASTNALRASEAERTPNENASTTALRASEAERTPNEKKIFDGCAR